MQNEPVLKIDENGTRYWYLNGEYHRADGPAVEYPDGSEHWYLNGKLHRTDGPAVELAIGNKFWFLDDKRYNFEEWLELTPLPIQEKVKLKLNYVQS